MFLANHVINTCMTHKVHAIFEQHLRNVFRTFIGHEPDMVYLHPGVVLKIITYLKPSDLEVFCSTLALWRLGLYSVTACYKRFPSKIKYKIKIIEMHLQNKSFFFHLFKIIINSIRTIQ